MSANKISVKLLGEFTITYKDTTVQFNEVATKQLSALMELFFLHPKQPLSKDKIIELMWKDSDNPTNALKFSIFRLRALLKSVLFFDEKIDLITTCKQGYLINPLINLNIDTENIEINWKESSQDNISQIESITKASNIIELYSGDLYESSGEHIWLAQNQAYYRGIYESSLEKVCAHCMLNDEYDRIILMAQKATTIDPYYENAYYYYLMALIEKTEYKRALTLFKDVQEIFMKEYGQGISNRIKSLYKIIVTKDEQEEIDIVSLRAKLNEELVNEGALACDYETFKYIYTVNSQNSRRDGLNQFLVVFELKATGAEEKLILIMKKLNTIIKNNLRKGDVYTILNKTQVAIILPCKTTDNGYNIIKRITTSFYKKINDTNIKLFYHLDIIGNTTKHE